MAAGFAAWCAFEMGAVECEGMDVEEEMMD